MSTIIDAVIIDTSAFMKEQSDFLGMNSAILPSFFHIVKNQNIELLSHPVLFEEIKKNIHESALLKRLDNLKTVLGKYKHVFPLIDISSDDAIKKIDNLNLDKKLIEAFEQAFSNATVLPFPSPESVFALYFDGKPPFSKTGEKRHEFPDAFVTESIKAYQRKNAYRTLLIISDDSDWKSAFNECSHTLLADSIADGMKILQSSENIIPVLESLIPQLSEDIKWHAESECYELDNSDLWNEDGLENIEVSVKDISTYITPLSITENSALFRTDCTLLVAGSASVRDENESYWDKEDSKYLFEKYYDISFNNGEAEIECEILITFDPDDPIDTAEVQSVKLILQNNISVKVDDDDIIYSDPAADAEADMLDTLEDYHQH